MSHLDSAENHLEKLREAGPGAREIDLELVHVKATLSAEATIALAQEVRASNILKVLELNLAEPLKIQREVLLSELRSHFGYS